jgi:hypothetical protein
MRQHRSWQYSPQWILLHRCFVKIKTWFSVHLLMSLSVLLMVTRTKTSNFNSSFSQDNSYNIQKSLEKTNRYVVHFIFTKTKIESICGMLLHSIERSPLKINVRENRRDNQEWKIQDEDKLKQKTQHNMCLTPSYGNKYK